LLTLAHFVLPPHFDHPFRLRRVNTYVRILGQIKTFSGKRHITAQHVRRIVDMNEILFHPVECVYVSLQSTRGPVSDTSS